MVDERRAEKLARQCGQGAAGGRFGRHGGTITNQAAAIFAFKKLGLTRREADVLLWIARGQSNAEIGASLRISPRTVKKHLEHIFKKLSVKTRLAAAVKAGEFYFNGATSSRQRLARPMRRHRADNAVRDAAHTGDARMAITTAC